MASNRISRGWLIGLFVLALAWAGLAQQASESAGRWYKGNLHTHTINSDGDSSPDTVVCWYREHQYDFLSLTDHNFFTETEGLSSVFGAKGKFLLVPGEEVSTAYGDAPIHVNALNLRSLIEPAVGPSVVGTVQNNVDRIQAAGALASVNHPNYGWAISPDQLRQVNGLKLFEIYNGHPAVNNWGGGGHASLDSLWDTLLTAGRRVHGIAVDDAHVFKVFGAEQSNPGRGWVMVKAQELSLPALLAAVEAGDFYATTGVVLDDVQKLPDGLRLKLPRPEDVAFTTEFLGANGKILATSFDLEPEYRLKPGQPYVRAVVTDSNGRRAWIQPVFAD